MKKVAYIGWVGKQNIGDDVCYDTVRNLIGNNVNLIPWDRGKWVYKTLPELCILGGGTILDIRFKRRERELLYPMYKAGVPIIIWGSGVVTPYSKRIHPKVFDILENAKFVGVRGPMSEKILKSKGFEKSEIIGDPALAYTERTGNLDEKKHSDTIAINIGYTRNNLYGTEKHVLQETIKLIHKLNKTFKIILFPMWPEDFKLIRKIPKIKSVQIREWSPDINSLITLFNESFCVIGMKLHAVVLSACALTPFISIGYREKCFDFAESMDLPNWVIKSNAKNLHNQAYKLIDTFLPKYYERVVEKLNRNKKKYVRKHCALAKFARRLIK